MSGIIRHVKRFYGLGHVPPVDNFDIHERKPLPRAPYLLQGRTRPNMIGRTTIREMLAGISRRAGARTHDGQPLLVLRMTVVGSSPRSTSTTARRRMSCASCWATSGSTPVMIYAKLYPGALVDAYRRHVRGLYQISARPRRPARADRRGVGGSRAELRPSRHGRASLRAPCGRALSKGLVCLGCAHAQPKKSAMPLFERMRASHARQLERAERAQGASGPARRPTTGAPRIESALRRTQELAIDVATAMEEALER